LGGHSIQYSKPPASKCSIQGYDSPERFETELAGGKYPDLDLEGVPVLDKRAALEADVRLAFDSPMVDPDLEPGTVSRFGDAGRASARAMLPALGGGFKALAATAVLDPSYGGLDYVAADLFVEWWRARGARAGRIVGGRITWEGGDHG